MRLYFLFNGPNNASDLWGSVHSKLARQSGSLCALSLFACAREGLSAEIQSRWPADRTVRRSFCNVTLMARYSKIAYCDEPTKVVLSGDMVSPVNLLVQWHYCSQRHYLTGFIWQESAAWALRGRRESLAH